LNFYLSVYSEGKLSKQQVAYISHKSENKKNVTWTQVNIIDQWVSVGSKFYNAFIISRQYNTVHCVSAVCCAESSLKLLLLLFLQSIFHSVAVVLTVVQIKQIRIDIHKRNNTKTQYKKYKTR
jgi:hypothetical protein